MFVVEFKGEYQSYEKDFRIVVKRLKVKQWDTTSYSSTIFVFDVRFLLVKREFVLE